MRTVYMPTILEKVDEEITKAKEIDRTIARIELTYSEFKEFISDISLFSGERFDAFQNKYVMYKGVCVQTCGGI